MKAYLITYGYEEFEKVVGIEQLKEFTQYRIENYDYDSDNRTFDYKDFNNLTESECLNVLNIDGYYVKIFEIE